MTNILAFPARAAATREAERLTALIACFATQRRADGDVFWFKENGELLNILETAAIEVPEGALDLYRPFYETLERRAEFFPQYYRFLLSIALDLEDLGLAGDRAGRLVAWLAQEGAAGAELSDLHRAEARRLMARRGIEALPGDTGLNDRLRAFAERSETFAVPNRKAAYDLTHTVFYLSEYGRKAPALGPGAAESLDFAGTVAFLDQNADLLSEVCIAMRFAGLVPAQAWEDWIAEETRGFSIVTPNTPVAVDGYHDYFVCNWHAALTGGRAFAGPMPAGPMAFRARRRSGVLQELSMQMFDLGLARSDEWGRMQPLLEARLAEPSARLVASAACATSSFERFFARFARVGLRKVAG